MADLISVDSARAHILSTATPIAQDNLPLMAAYGRTLSKDVKACLSQPPFTASAMDGYAIRSEDAIEGRKLKIIGSAPAGHMFAGKVYASQALRLFTGSIMPDGADHVVIQEDVSKDKDTITITNAQYPPAHIRKAGIDFMSGETLFTKGTRLGPIHLSALAAANIETVPIARRPKVGYFANGDELKPVGTPLHAGQIISSTPFAIHALIEAWGAEPEFFGIIPDNKSDLANVISRLTQCDIIVPLGGASVGDFDLVKAAFRAAGYITDFEKIAVKPGKPTWFAHKHVQTHLSRVLGLPGNPASGLVCAHLFLRPLIKALTGTSCATPLLIPAILDQDLGTNGPRETYHRARYTISKKAQLVVTPLARQDSSLLTPFTQANALIRQQPRAAKRKAGDQVEIYKLTSDF